MVKRACAIVSPDVFSNIRSHKSFLTITKTIGELFRDESVRCGRLTPSNIWVKQAMLQTLGHLISIIPSHFNVRPSRRGDA